MYRAANRGALDKCLARTLPLLGSPHVVEERKPYWKDAALWECAVRVPLSSTVVAEQVLDCLVAAYAVARGWHLMGSLDRERAEGLEGVFETRHSGSTSKVAGLEWAHFEVVSDCP